MNKIILLILIFSPLGIFAQKNVVKKFPYSINHEKVDVLSINNDIATLRANEKFEIWQFNIETGVILNHFKPKSGFIDEIYQSYFRDGGIEQKSTLEFCKDNNVRTPPVKFLNCYINIQNEVFCLVQILKMVPAPSRNPDSASIIPKFSLIKIGKNTVEKFYSIKDDVVSNEYFLRGDGDFFYDKNLFYFTISKQNLTNKDNFFLASWKVKSDELIFNEIKKIELPSKINMNSFGYGLIRFISKKNYLMFYSNPNIININESSTKIINLRNWEQPDLKSTQIGKKFNIEYAICDFYETTQKIVKIIYRNHDKFILVYFNNKTNNIIVEIEIENVKANELFRFPFFSNKGEIVILKKDSKEIQLIRF